MVYAKKIEFPRDRKFKWIDLFVGGAERAIALTLTLSAPAQLPAFIGAWIAFKMAANWQRRTEPKANQATLVALIGSAISFAFAIYIGWTINPTALTVWNR